MSVDWITVAAQLANFLVLVWLLKRFLYRPILDGIDAREAEITNRMEAALRAQDAARTAETDFTERLAELQSEQAAIAEAARREAEDEKGALLAQAHERIERERAAWSAHLDEAARVFTARLHQAGSHALLELTRKALNDLADDALETRIASHLARQITAMNRDLQRAAGTPQEAIVTSHAAMPPAAQDDITTALRQSFPDLRTRFETDRTQAPGVSLHLGGARLAWTIDTYIDGLDAAVTRQLASGPDKRMRAG